MAFKITDRMQKIFLPDCIDDYVGPEDPVRVYDQFIDALDFQALGIQLEPSQGQDAYYPKMLLKILVYGYAYGLRSSRPLERACHHNLSFIWLTGNLKPDYRTIARFRAQYKEALKGVLRQCVRRCIELDLVDGNMLFIDGSALRANASIANSWNKKRCLKHLQKLDQRIEELVEESQKIDRDEDPGHSLVKNNQELKSCRERKTKIKQISEIVAQKQATAEAARTNHIKEPNVSHNTVDGECVKMNSRQGKHASYNAQLVTDGKHGLIVHSESTGASTDAHQLNRQLAQATAMLDKKPEYVAADAGYYAIKDMVEVDKDITVVIPDLKQAHQRKYPDCPADPFSKEHFTYDLSRNQYICPAGQTLTYQGTISRRETHIYQARGHVCRGCRHFGTCTTSADGRRITRSAHEPLKEQLKTVYESPQGQAIYNRRKEVAELPFGHFKRNLSAGQFLLRGLLGTNAELALLSTCFNLRRMITIIGVAQLMLKMPTVT